MTSFYFDGKQMNQIVEGKNNSIKLKPLKKPTANTLRKAIKKEFEKVSFTVTFGDEFINIARADGVHCEFYGFQEHDYFCTSATYSLYGQEYTDLDFHFSSVNDPDFKDLFSSVQEILKV